MVWLFICVGFGTESLCWPCTCFDYAWCSGGSTRHSLFWPLVRIPEATSCVGLKGHLQPVCIAVVHFTEIICCNTEITNVSSVFDNRTVSMFLLRSVSQPAIALGCEDIIRFSNTTRTFVISVLQQMISVKCTTAMHSGCRCTLKVIRFCSKFNA